MKVGISCAVGVTGKRQRAHDRVQRLAGGHGLLHLPGSKPMDQRRRTDAALGYTSNRAALGYTSNRAVLWVLPPLP